MYGKFFALMIAMVATVTSAEELCILPVHGGEAKLPVEFKQPYRIAMSSQTAPGFDGLIVHAINRRELYEFDGSNLTLIEDDFPHAWGFAFKHGIHLGPGGEAFGFGSRPRLIFHLGSNTSRWEPIEVTSGYDRAFFDQGSGDVYWQTPSSGQLNRIGANGDSEAVDLPLFNGDQTISVRTIPEINGSLALTGPRSSTPRQSSSLWFRPLGEK